MRKLWITTVEYVDGTYEEYEGVSVTMHDRGNVVMLMSEDEDEKIFIPLNNVKRIVGKINYCRGLENV